jgi:hypothetical protein
VTDPGTDTVSSYLVHWGDGSTSSYSSNLGAKSHTYADGPSNHAITVDLTDEDGTFFDRADALSVQVDNVAPSIAISGNTNVNEGSAYSLTLGAVTDPGADTVSGYLVHWGDGSTSSYSSNLGAKTHTYADGPNDYAITVDLTDEDGTFLNRANALSVHVVNVAPSVTFTVAPDTANEGETKTYTYSVSDPGTLDTFTVDATYPKCGYYGTIVGTPTKTASGGSFQCNFPDGPNTTSVAIKVTDSDGGSDTASKAVQIVDVANVAPTATLANNGPIPEGGNATVSFSNQLDPSAGDTAAGFHYAFSCSNGDLSGATYAGSGTSASQLCSYDDGPSNHTVKARIIDRNGGFTEYTTVVHVNNVDPTATLGNNGPINEGGSATISFSAKYDPSTADTAAGFRYQYHCDGSAFAGAADYATASTSDSTSCSFGDDGSYTVSARIIDKDDGSTTYTTQVEVNNVAPSITISGDANVNEGSTYTLNLGAVTDLGADTVSSYVVHWGDSSSDTYATNGDKTHTYADGPNSYDITVDLIDEDGTFSDAANDLAVSVLNVAPSIAISGAPNVNEGSAYSLTLGAVTDPGTDAVSSYIVHWGDGNSNTYSSNVGAKSHTYADGPNSYDITVDLIDEDGTFSDAANDLSVSVLNVAPSIAISGNANVNEGSPYTLNLGTVTDPGADTVSSWIVHWGDGSTVTYTSDGDKTHTYADGPSDHAITVDLVDEDNTFLNRANAFSVHVVNVAPSIPSLNSPADNSTTTNNKPAFDWDNSTDPAGANDTITYRIQIDNNCDFSSPERNEVTSSSDFTPLAALADGTYCWRVSGSDEDGGTSDYSSVRRLTIDATVPAVVSINRADASPTNASSVSWTVKFSESVSGVDTTDFVLASTGLGGSPTVTNVAGSGDTYTVTASTGSGSGTLGLNLGDDDTISDNAGNPLGGTGIANGSFTGEVYTIDRSALTVSINQAVGQLDPTSTAPIKFAVVFNKPVNDFTNADVDLSSSTAGGTLIANVYNPSYDKMNYEVRVNGMTTAGDVVINIGAGKATDAAGNGNQTATIIDNKVTWNQAVGNNTPDVGIDSPQFGSTYAKGSASITLKAHFTDPDNGPWTYTINWDDGTANNTGSLTASGQSFQQNHSFSNTGVYTINVCVKDFIGASGCAQVWIVVYDPSGGFVTGGGFINVGAGSYTGNPALTGRANFGFNSQYKKNAMIPTGETEFNFQVGNFNFHSEAYTWLVVSGYKAQYKGTGSVNGVSGYDFTLTAYDGDITGGGGTDKFRIRITKKNGGDVVFDNKILAPAGPDNLDTADPQAIAGGSIVIHKA